MTDRRVTRAKLQHSPAEYLTTVCTPFSISSILAEILRWVIIFTKPPFVYPSSYAYRWHWVSKGWREAWYQALYMVRQEASRALWAHIGCAFRYRHYQKFAHGPLCGHCVRKHDRRLREIDWAGPVFFNLEAAIRHLQDNL